MKEEKQTSTKTKKSLFGSLAFRVLLISFVFIIVPLIFYSVVMYARDYEQRLSEVFEELHLSKDDQMNHITEVEIMNLNFLFAVNGMLNLLYEKHGELTTEQLSPILEQFADKEDISAIFFLRVEADKKLICEYSTLPEYQGINFSPYFSYEYLRTIHDNTFIAKDPIFKQSLFLTLDIKDEDNNIIGILASSISLDLLINRLSNLRTLLDSNISIMNEDHKIISSSEAEFIGKEFVREDRGNVANEIIINEVEGIPTRYRFNFKGKERLAVIAVIPQTEKYLIISIPANVLLIQIYRYIWHLAMFLIFILIIGGAATYLLTLRMSRPLTRLRKVMQKVGEGDLEQRFTRDPMGFEINYLGDRFNEMVSSLVNYIEEVKTERAVREAFEKELEIGHDIQRSILPHRTIHFPGLEIGIFFSPAKEVAGDYYDWLHIDNKILLVVADGVGKGISGCLYAYDLRSILRSFATLEHNLEKMVVQTNKLFCFDTKETGNFVTAFIATFDSTTKKLSSVNCGHNYPIIKRASGSIERIKLHGTAFGIEEFEKLDMGEHQLQEGDFVVFFTDGVTDAQNEADELFTEARLENVIIASKATTPDDLIEDIKVALQEFTQSTNQYDDITILVIKSVS